MKKWLVLLMTIIVISLILRIDGSAAAQTAPTVSVWPFQAKIGSQVTVSGSGFSVNSTVGVQFVGKGRTVGTDEFGRFQTNFFVPVAGPGQHDVDVFSWSTTASSFFEILPPTFTMSSWEIRSGDKITLKIEGAIPFTLIKAYLGENEIRYSPDMLTGSEGSIEVVIPPVSPGIYPLKIFKGTKFEASVLVTIIPESPRKITRVLSPISDKVIRVWAYDGRTETWKLYDPALPPELNTLKEFSPGEGYFVLVKENCEMFSLTFRWPLFKGWNLIGWVD